MSASLQTLKAMFADRPEVLTLFDRRELDLQGLTDTELAKSHRHRQLFPQPINLYVTGRTGAGKSSLGNRFLDGNPLPSTGYQDCTDVVQYFRLKSNLIYFDLPGSGSSDAYENINRAAVLSPQLEDEFEKVFPTSVVPLLDFSPALAEKRQPKRSEATDISLAKWESAECRQLYEPDVILYVIAPHAMWLRPDRDYLVAILKARKARFKFDVTRPDNIVFALNMHQNPDGAPKSTMQLKEGTLKSVNEIWQFIYPGTQPQIIEVNAMTGAGMQLLTQALCRALPPNKIGNMEQVLSSDLKAAATAERSRRYHGLLAAVASRLATYRVDATIGRDDLLKEAFAAIGSYAVSIFHEEEAVLAAQRDLVQVAANAAKEAREARAKGIEITQNDVVMKEIMEEVITGYKPVKEEVEVPEIVETIETATVRKSKSFGAKLFVGLGEAVEHIFASPVSAIEMLCGNDKTENHRVRDRYRDGYSYDETVIRPTKKTITRFVEQITGFEEQKETVKRMIPEVVSRQERVGTEYLTGGSRVIEDVFALGMAAERVPGGGKDFAQRFADAVSAARQEIQRKLGPLSPRIDTAAANSNPNVGERELYELLMKVFAA